MLIFPCGSRRLWHQHRWARWPAQGLYRQREDFIGRGVADDYKRGR
nr:MAG TPA: hypothetical protein [Caudoviricetes sp.]